jgi:carboxymethylenebutenolidase
MSRRPAIVAPIAVPDGIATGEAFVDTPDGPMECLIARPAGPGAVDAMIMYHHVGGLTRTMRMMACRAARGGYLCVVPDLYHRLGTIVTDPESTDDKVLAIQKLAAASLNGRGVMRDTRAVLDWLAAQTSAKAGRRGAIGYGRGGSLAALAAGTYPQDIPAAASVLGFGFVRDADHSPHLVLDRIKELYLAFAEHDDIIPAGVPRQLEFLLKSSTVKSKFVTHPGARHPYAFPDRAVYDPAAAEADWREIFAMFARHHRQ